MTLDMAFLFGLVLNCLYLSCCFAFDGIPLDNVRQGCVDQRATTCATMTSSMCQKGPIAKFCCKTCQTLQENSECVDKSPDLCAQMNSSMCQKGPIATFCCKTCQTLQEKSVCITSCDGLADNDYQSCTGCSVYSTCANKYFYDNRPCPLGLVWTDDYKRCDYSSTTCTEKKNLIK